MSAKAISKASDGAWLFAQECRFVAGADTLDRLPPPGLPEVAFAGRSNVGKSSLLNALTGRKHLARVSNTPGRTQQINFFDLGSHLMLVDLPGHGYAKVSKSKVKGWTRLVDSYIRGRPNLRRILLLVDANVGTKDADETLMDLMDESGLSYQIVMTKADRLKAADLGKMRAWTGSGGVGLRRICIHMVKPMISGQTPIESRWNTVPSAGTANST